MLTVKIFCLLVPSCFLLPPSIYRTLKLVPSSSQSISLLLHFSVSGDFSQSLVWFIQRFLADNLAGISLIFFFSFLFVKLWRNLRPWLLCYCFSVFRLLSPVTITVKLFPRVFSSSKLRDLVFSLVTRESLGALTPVSTTANLAAYVSLSL